MAKMNSSGASPSRLVPPGICNHNANPPCIPDKMISTAKSILYNEIPDEPQPQEAPCFGPRRAKLSTSLPLSPPYVLLLTAEILFLPRRLEPAMPRPAFTRNAQRETDLSPS